MEELKVAVILKESRQRIKVYPKWIKGVNYQSVFNRGVNKSEDHTIFYSPDKKADPNFELPVSAVFDPNSDGCYIARIFMGFDDDDAADEYILRKRSVLPVDYGIFFNGKGTGTTTRRSNQMSAGTSGEAPVNNPDNRIFGAKSVNTSGHLDQDDKEDDPCDDGSDDEIIVTMFSKEHRPMFEEIIKLETGLGLPLSSLAEMPAMAINDQHLFPDDKDNAHGYDFGADVRGVVENSCSRIYDEKLGIGSKCEPQTAAGTTTQGENPVSHLVGDIAIRGASKMSLTGHVVQGKLGEDPYDDGSENEVIITMFSKEHRPIFEEPIKLETGLGLPLSSLAEIPTMAKTDMNEQKLVSADEDGVAAINTDASAVTNNDNRDSQDCCNNSVIEIQCQRQVAAGADTQVQDSVSRAVVVMVRGTDICGTSNIDVNGHVVQGELGEDPHDDGSDDEVIITMFSKDHRPIFEEPIKLETGLGLPLSSLAEISTIANNNEHKLVSSDDETLQDSGKDDAAGTGAESLAAINNDRDNHINGKPDIGSQPVYQVVVGTDTKDEDPLTDDKVEATAIRSASNFSLRTIARDISSGEIEGSNGDVGFETQKEAPEIDNEQNEVKTQIDSDVADMKVDAAFSGGLKFYEFLGTGRQYLHEGLILPTIPNVILSELRKCSCSTNSDHVKFLTILLLHFVRGPYGILAENRINQTVLRFIKVLFHFHLNDEVQGTQDWFKASIFVAWNRATYLQRRILENLKHK